MTTEARLPSSSRKKATPSTQRAGGPGGVSSSHGLSPSANHPGFTQLPSSNNGPANYGPTVHDSTVLHHYQAAVQLLQQAKFEKALVAFEKLLATAPPALAERCRMYVTACHRQLTKTKLEFATPEEQYDYAVSLLNTDYYEEAREQFMDILRGHPDADYALYGLAVLDSMTGQVEECLEHLARSIEGNPKNRLQARTDTDFQSMQDDPRFTELLYPEIP
jgi:tetratricopeptide (TPR) repeat protein